MAGASFTRSIEFRSGRLLAIEIAKRGKSGMERIALGLDDIACLISILRECKLVSKEPVDAPQPRVGWFRLRRRGRH